MKIKLIVALSYLFLLISLNIKAANNLASGKPSYANAFTVEWEHYVNQANDGKMDTRWQSTKDKGALISTGRYEQKSWWFVDLQNQYSIEGIQIYWEAAAAIEYSILVSDDSINWTKIFTENNGTGSFDQIRFDPVITRFVRIETSIGNMEWAPSMWEFQVYERGNLPLLDYFTESFNSGDSKTVKYSDLDPEAPWKMETISVLNGDSAIKIQAPYSESGFLNNNPIVIDFESSGKRDFSKNPYIYFKYKSDNELNVMIRLVAGNKIIMVPQTHALYACPDWMEFRDSLLVDSISLETVHLIELYFFSKSADMQPQAKFIAIDDIRIGSSCPAYTFKIFYPSAGSQYKIDDIIQIITNAPSEAKVQFFVNGISKAEITKAPYNYTTEKLTEGFYNVMVNVNSPDGKLLYTTETNFAVPGLNGPNYKDDATEYLFKSLKAITNSDYIMFGMANALTISYNGGPKHAFNGQSDSKDITGSHPAFVESDFMWYSDKTFKANDIEAMKQAYQRGAVLGYCWHMGGRYSGSFYVDNNGVKTADAVLVKEIVANPDRSTNPSLDWYLSKYDKEAIPVFKELGFPLVFRPLHEMTGGWFWWGNSSCTAEEFVKLYRLTVDYLRANGIKNLLYAWAPDKSTNMNYYPGDDYIDVIGYDGYEVGIAAYHTKTQFTNNIKKLSDYAVQHNKIVAVTETGGANDQYPAKYPKYWSDNILKTLKADPKTRKIAWVMTWYSADWNHNQAGICYIPYLGIESKTNGQEAIDDFQAFYDDPTTLFENDLPNLYLKGESKAFVYPVKLELTEGETYTLIGGAKNSWANNDHTWKSEKPEIATIDNAGLITAIKEGAIEIIVTAPDGSTAFCQLTVKKEPKTVGINEQMEKIKFYPNPVTNNQAIFDCSSDNSEKVIIITDLQGKCVYSTKTSESQIRLNTKSFVQGCYIVNITSLRSSQTVKMIVN